MRIAVITPVSGRHDHLRLQRQALLAATVHPDMHVVVAINDRGIGRALDRSPPRPEIIDLPAAGPLPLAAARNLGAQHALTADADLLIFLDVDCAPSPQLVARYADRATRAGQRELLCGPVAYLPPPPPAGYRLAALATLGQPHAARPVPPETGVLSNGDHTLFWSLSFAISPALWQKLGGFCEQYTGYGAEDTDFGQIAASHGIPLTWVGGAWAYHQYHPVSDPPRQHLADIVRNAAIFHHRWGWWPMTGWLRAFEEEGLIRYNPATSTWTIVQPGRPLRGALRPSRPRQDW